MSASRHGRSRMPPASGDSSTGTSSHGVRGSMTSSAPRLARHTSRPRGPSVGVGVGLGSRAVVGEAARPRHPPRRRSCPRTASQCTRMPPSPNHQRHASRSAPGHEPRPPALRVQPEADLGRAATAAGAGRWCRGSRPSGSAGIRDRPAAARRRRRSTRARSARGTPGRRRGRRGGAPWSSASTRGRWTARRSARRPRGGGRAAAPPRR